MTIESQSKSNSQRRCRATAAHNSFRSIVRRPIWNRQWANWSNSRATICHVCSASLADLRRRQSLPECIRPTGTSLHEREENERTINVASIFLFLHFEFYRMAKREIVHSVRAFAHTTAIVQSAVVPFRCTTERWCICHDFSCIRNRKSLDRSVVFRVLDARARERTQSWRHTNRKNNVLVLVVLGNFSSSKIIWNLTQNPHASVAKCRPVGQQNLHTVDQLRTRNIPQCWRFGCGCSCRECSSWSWWMGCDICSQVPFSNRVRARNTNECMAFSYTGSRVDVFALVSVRCHWLIDNRNCCTGVGRK